MKIARAIKNEWAEPIEDLAIKLFNKPRRRGEAQLGAPLAGIDDRQTQRLISPRVIEIEMNCAAQKNLFGNARLKSGVALFRQAKVFRDFFQSWIETQRFFVLQDRL
jgi:hypothetical protein